MKVAIAGASGFVGELLLKELSDSSPEIHCVALGRSVSDASQESPKNIEWKNCDLFSLLQIEKALEGVDIGVYLVHSMMPRAKLSQCSFDDCDLLLADNFARAAKKMGLKRILFLSGLVPPITDVHNLSPHLRSRVEVEQTLASLGTPVTILRSGLILGPKGSSFQMIYLLVKRLPVMICPKWTQTRTQCISAADVVKLLHFCINDERTSGKTYDIGNPQIFTYQELMKTLAQVMGKKRILFPVPFFSPGLSRYWIQCITGGSRNLVEPLVHSLKHEMLVKNTDLLKLYGKPLTPIQEALKASLKDIKPTLRSSTRTRRKQLQGIPEVRSIQRLPMPARMSAGWIANEYMKWLPRFLRPFVKVTQDNKGDWVFHVLLIQRPLLKLSYSKERSTDDRQLFYIKGGVLVRNDQSPSARLEFRQVLNKTACLAAIHEFKPRLPWMIYKYSQAIAHWVVMRSFGRRMGRTAG